MHPIRAHRVISVCCGFEFRFGNSRSATGETLMTIRSTLAILLSVFGLMLVVLLVSQGSATYRNYNDGSEQIVIDQARNDLLRAIVGLQNDRARIVLIAAEAESAGDSARLLYPSVDLMRRASETLNATDKATLQDLGAAIGRQVALLSYQADEFAAVLASGDPDAIWAQSFIGIEQIDLMQQRLLEIRRGILLEVGIADTVIGGLQMLRNYIVSVNNSIQRNRVLVLLELEESAFSHPPAARQIDDYSRTLQAADSVYLDTVRLFDESLIDLASELSDFLSQTYVPAEVRLLRAVDAGQGTDAARPDWVAAGDEAGRLIDSMLGAVFDRSQTYLAQAQADAHATLVRLSILSVFALLMFGLSLFIIAVHIVSPLEQVRTKMLELAEGDLSRVTLDKFVLQDLRGMVDALRVFRITGVRRERLTRERLSLHAQIADAHHNLKADMAAASKVQLSQMPEPGDVGSIRFASFFAPSHVLAGDTFDYLELSEDRAGLFQVDVAGHGAAAGLVSVAAHIGARRALRSLKPGDSLAKAARTLNAHWNPEMTYFTLALTEFDTRANTGRLVQAGHPHPVLMRRDGSVSRLGNGGLPIGVLPDAEFEEVVFQFEVGDRVLVFSDGIYENANSENEIYTEERFIQFLTDNATCSTEVLLHDIREALVAWTGAGNLSDDVSVVIAERV